MEQKEGCYSISDLYSDLPSTACSCSEVSCLYCNEWRHKSLNILRLNTPGETENMSLNVPHAESENIDSSLPSVEFMNVRSNIVMKAQNSVSVESFCNPNIRSGEIELDPLMPATAFCQSCQAIPNSHPCQCFVKEAVPQQRRQTSDYQINTTAPARPLIQPNPTTSTKFFEESCCRVIVIIVCIQVALGLAITSLSLVLLFVSDVFVELGSAPIWAGIPSVASGCSGFYLTSRRTRISRNLSISYGFLTLSFTLSLVAATACAIATVLTGLHAIHIYSYSRCLPSTSWSSYQMFEEPQHNSPAFVSAHSTSQFEEDTNENISAVTIFPKTSTATIYKLTTKRPGEILCICQTSSDEKKNKVSHIYYGYNGCKYIFYSLKDQLILISIFAVLACGFAIILAILIIRGDYASVQDLAIRHRSGSRNALSSDGALQSDSAIPIQVSSTATEHYMGNLESNETGRFASNESSNNTAANTLNSESLSSPSENSRVCQDNIASSV